MILSHKLHKSIEKLKMIVVNTTYLKFFFSSEYSNLSNSILGMGIKRTGTTQAFYVIFTVGIQF